MSPFQPMVVLGFSKYTRMMMHSVSRNSSQTAASTAEASELIGSIEVNSLGASTSSRPAIRTSSVVYCI